MKKYLRPLLFILISMFLISCGSSRIKKSNKNVIIEAPANKIKTNPEIEPEDERVYNIVQKARDFEGTRYKYGGTDKNGIDCSGLIYTSFLEEDVSLPRVSRQMALEGKRLHFKEITAGDLLFFETNKNKKVINHVGLVVDVLPDQILFIHSSTSKGVIVSSLSESYWYNNFVMARRVM